MNMRLGKKIGEGACSEVFEWENEYKIVKLAKSNTSVDDLSRELRNNRLAWESGLPVPQGFELVNINGQPGIVFERIYGKSLMERFVDNVMNQANRIQGIENIADYSDIRVTAQLLYEIHLKSIPSMPSQREGIKYSIHRGDLLTAAEEEIVIDILDHLPIKHQLCHGDPNPGNILMRDDKAVAIDWNNASIGNPEADLADYIIMIRYAILASYLPDELKMYFNTFRESIINVFVEEYVRLSGITYDDIDPWIVPMAARKLSIDAICEDEKNLLVNEIRRRIKLNMD